ncbi:hypothetical protein [Kingella sp. (in: b-proteobacteria)]|nr:hypothetical protein [Kingella sp. (in: b-proteobacteria)]MDO4658734.1 hypothetical protein [Kingella sp. (in: b-proteobacteria)]
MKRILLATLLCIATLAQAAAPMRWTPLTTPKPPRCYTRNTKTSSGFTA